MISLVQFMLMTQVDFPTNERAIYDKIDANFTEATKSANY